jgi:lipopolysaccharide heptosyltransferase I
VPAHEAQPTELSQRRFSRILLVKPSSLGDVIHALPVLNGLRQRYPDARIDWLIGSAFAPLLEGHPAISHLVLFDRRRYGRMIGSPRVAADFMRFLAELRRTRYELVVDLQGLFRSGFLTRMTGAPIRMGFRDAREGARMFYTHYLPESPVDTHAVDRNYTVAHVLGFADLPVEFRLPINADARAAVDRLLDSERKNSQPPTRAALDLPEPQASTCATDRRIGLHSAEPPLDSERNRLVVMAPGARWETKRWPVDRFAEVVNALSADGARCVLVGGGDEAQRCSDIASRCRTAPLNLAGQTTLPQLAAVVARADLVLCHDSAVAHLAVAVGRPVVCISGPTNPARTGPYRGGTVVRLPLDCSPCYLRRLSQCPHRHRCMIELTAEQVTSVVLDDRTSMATAR